MPEKTQQFAQNIARSLIGGVRPRTPRSPLIQMQGIRKSYYIGQPNELEIPARYRPDRLPRRVCRHRGRVRLR